jgi:hypothetical protein
MGKPAFEHNPCRQCRGFGRHADIKCRGCGGSGYTLTKRGFMASERLRELKTDTDTPEQKAANLEMALAYQATLQPSGATKEVTR